MLGIAQKTTLIRERHLDVVHDLVVSFFALVAFIMLFPLWSVLMVSVSDPETLAKSIIILFPKKLDFSSYQYIFQVPSIPAALLTSIKVTVIGTAINMVVTFSYAYAISIRDLPAKKFFVTLAIIPMFFNGGLIPLYITVRDYGLMNSLWSMILPLSINIWYLIIIKNHFVDMPSSLRESAMIDGANEIKVFLWIMLPLSKAIMATFLLFYAVERWNEWFLCNIFINNGDNFTLQKILRDIMINNMITSHTGSAMFRNMTNQFVDSQSVKMATTVVAVVPIALIYPFLQKYFIKGIYAGAIKG